MRGNFVLMFWCINLNEVKMLDVVLGVYVKFRLVGVSCFKFLLEFLFGISKDCLRNIV